jgi:hypothetical protein
MPLTKTYYRLKAWSSDNITIFYEFIVSCVFLGFRDRIVSEMDFKKELIHSRCRFRADILSDVVFVCPSLLSYRLPPTDYWLSTIDYRLSPIVYRLSPIGYRLSTIDYRLLFTIYFSILNSQLHSAAYRFSVSPISTQAGATKISAISAICGFIFAFFALLCNVSYSLFVSMDKSVMGWFGSVWFNPAAI